MFAGLLSFISPCVLPLIPAYISYLTARAAQQTGAEAAVASVGNRGAALTLPKNRIGILLHGVFFVLGFTVVFVVFGLITNTGALAVRRASIDAQRFLAQAGGVLVIFFGLHILGVWGWVLRRLSQLAWDKLGSVGTSILKGINWILLALYGDMRQQMNPRSPYGYLGSSLMGVVFAAGWSPCIGPILGSILTILTVNSSLGTSTTESYTQATTLLLAYSLGLGIPFLLAAVALDSVRGFMKRIQRQMRAVEVVSGIFLIILGFMLLTGTLTAISQSGSGLATISANLEACGIGIVEGKMSLGDFGDCLPLGTKYAKLIPDTSKPPTTNSLIATPAPSNTSALETGLDRGQIPPDFKLKTLNGKTVSLSALKGRVVVVNFWATWCVPCAKEMPDFEQLTQKYTPDQFTIVAVNYMQEPDVISEFMKEYKLTFDIALDPDGKINRQYQVLGYPTSLILNRDGVIVGKQTGAFDPVQLVAAINELVTQEN